MEAKKAKLRSFFDALEGQEVRDAIEELMPEYRDRIYSPTVTLAMLLRQVLSDDRSCRKAVDEAIFSGIVDREASPNTASYCNARQRLPQELIARLTAVIAQQIHKRAPAAWKWRGREIKLVDGTTILMEDTVENQEEFPQHKQQKDGAGFPIARLVAIISLCTAAVLSVGMAAYSGKGTGEHALLRDQLSCISTGDVLVGDAYYASYFLMAALQAIGADFVFEQHGARDTDFRAGQRIGNRDHLVKLPKPNRPGWMTAQDYELYPSELTVREAKVRGKVLVTSFINPRKVPKDELGRLFAQRWHVEVDLRNIKTTLNMAKLRCKSPQMCTKELWAYMLAYNVIRLLMAESAQRVGVLPRQLSFKQTVQSWLAWLHRRVRSAKSESLNLLFRLIGHLRVGDRPGRVEPRAVKQRPKPFPRLTTTRREARARVTRRYRKRLAA
jgi:hypothetical protein